MPDMECLQNKNVITSNFFYEIAEFDESPNVFRKDISQFQAVAHLKLSIQRRDKCQTNVMSGQLLNFGLLYWVLKNDFTEHQKDHFSVLGIHSLVWIRAIYTYTYRIICVAFTQFSVEHRTISTLHRVNDSRIWKSHTRTSLNETDWWNLRVMKESMHAHCTPCE